MFMGKEAEFKLGNSTATGKKDNQETASSLWVPHTP